MTLTAILKLFPGYTTASQIEYQKGFCILKRNGMGRVIGFSLGRSGMGRDDTEPLIQIAGGNVRPTT